ncbi:MAG: endoflagellar motor protein [Deltaproteobacteria bacterium]|nr:MAG: endoflagellar motor protein [Deltaproteobacteria bacterium]
MTRLVPLVLGLAVLTACIPKGKYVALEEELASTRSELEQQIAARDATIADQEATISKLQGQVRDLEGAIKKITAELASREKQLEALNAEKASALADKGALKAQIEEMKQALAELQERKAQAEARVAEFKDLLAKFQSLIDSGTLEVKIVDGRMVVAMATDVLFASGSASLSAEGKTAVQQVAEVLATIPDRSFQVEGHTDNVPMKGSERYPNNWYLGAGRAISVTEAMIEAGMPVETISASSYGEHRPTTSNETKEGKAQNRRIEIVVMPDLSLLPGYEELEKMVNGG